MFSNPGAHTFFVQKFPLKQSQIHSLNSRQHVVDKNLLNFREWTCVFAQGRCVTSEY
jgi:hypothetical protein